jgi:hypothetical protein
MRVTEPKLPIPRLGAALTQDQDQRLLHDIGACPRPP